MAQVRKALFPAILFSIFVVFTITRLIGNPQVVRAENDPVSLPGLGGQPEIVAAGQSAAQKNPPAGQSTAIPVVDPIFVTVPPPTHNGLLSSARPGDPNCSLSAEFLPSVLQWCGLIEKYARDNGLEPGLVAALITQESGGDSQAYSSSGAVGLMQIMPSDGLASSFMCAAGPCFTGRPSSAELKDPEYNIAYGTRLLAALTQKYGNVREALKNYGPIDVGYYYADLVMGIFSNKQ